MWCGGGETLSLCRRLICGKDGPTLGLRLRSSAAVLWCRSGFFIGGAGCVTRLRGGRILFPLTILRSSDFIASGRFTSGFFDLLGIQYK